MKRLKILFIATLLFLSFEGISQKLVRGFVIDSASFAPLAYVSIHVKNTGRGTTTDEKGGFSLQVQKDDSLSFSLVGYNPEEFSAAELEETVIIRMAIHVRQLDVITIVGKKEKEVRPTHISSKGGTPTYAPYSAGVNFAYFTKLEREKRKLKQIQAEYLLVRNYVAVVCSPDVRERICAEFSLTEDEYFQLLAKFNQINKDAHYDLTSEEWITVLRQFCAAHVVKK